MAKTQEIKIKVRALGTRTVGNKFSALKGQMRRFGSHLPSLRTSLLAVTAAATGLAAGIFALTKSTAAAGDMFHKMSLRTGMSAQALSELKHAAEISGATIEAVEKGIKTLAKRISDARFGLLSYVRIFKNLNVEYMDAKGNLRDVDAVMMDAFDAINKLSGKTEKLAMATELFGKAGTMLLPLMKEGKEGMEALREEARRLGITFSDEDALASAKFNDELTRLKGSLSGVKKGIAMDLMPALTDFFNRLSQYIAENRPQIVALAKDFINSVASMAESVAIGGGTIIDWLSKMGAGYRELKMLDIKTAMTYSEGWIKILEKLGISAKKLKDDYYDMGMELQRLRTEQAAWQADPGIAKRIRALIDELKNIKVDDLLKPDKDKVSDDGDPAGGLTKEERKKKLDVIRKYYKEWAVAHESLTDRLKKSTLNRFDYERLQLEKYVEDYKTKWGETVTLRKYYAVEMERIADEQAEHEKNKAKESFDLSKTLMENTARQMQNVFSTFFFDVMKGEFKKLEDYLTGFANSMLQVISQLLAKMVVLKMFPSLVGAGFHQGGVIPAYQTAGFSIMPRYHTGGLRNNERFTINKVGERYITKEQNEWLTSLAKNMKDGQSLTVNVPISGIHNREVMSELRAGVEQTVIEILRRHQ